jgi:hypothetical protein
MTWNVASRITCLFEWSSSPMSYNARENIRFGEGRGEEEACTVAVVTDDDHDDEEAVVPHPSQRKIQRLLPAETFRADDSPSRFMALIHSLEPMSNSERSVDDDDDDPTERSVAAQPLALFSVGEEEEEDDPTERSVAVQPLAPFSVGESICKEAAPLFTRTAWMPAEVVDWIFPNGMGAMSTISRTRCALSVERSEVVR